MVLLGKIALGFAGTVVAAGAYTFHQGLVRVDVDENRSHGSHVHVWAPAAMVPMVMHFVPRHVMENAGYKAGKFMPLVHTLAKELARYPEAEFVEVTDGEQHVQIRTHHGSLLIDVSEPGQEVHVACPLATMDDISAQLASYAPGA